LAPLDVYVTDADLGEDLTIPVPRFPADRQCLLQVGERAPEVAQPIVGGTPVLQESRFPQPVTGLAEERQSRRIGLEGLAELAQIAIENAEIAERPGLSSPVAQRALQLEDLPVARQRRVGLSQADVDRRQVVEHVRLPEPLLASPLEHVERLTIEVQRRAQVSLGVEGEAEVVERLALLDRTAEPAFESQRLTLRRRGSGRVPQCRAGETDAAPGRRLPGLIRQPGEQIERLLIVLQSRFRLAESRVDSAQREIATRLLL